MADEQQSTPKYWVKVNEVDLRTYGFIFNGELNIGVTKPQRALEDIPGRHGPLVKAARYKEKIIKMSGVVRGDTFEELKENVDTMCGLVDQIKTPVKLEISGYDDRYWMVLLEEADTPKNIGPNLNHRHENFTLTFSCVPPFSLAANENLAPFQIKNGEGICSLGNSDNNGNVEVSPVIKITVKGSDSGDKVNNIEVTNSANSQSFKLTGTYDEGDTFNIDCDRMIAEKNDANHISNFDGDFIALEAAKYNPNTLTVTYDGTGMLQMDITFTERYLR